jgi:hypothetical protein
VLSYISTHSYSQHQLEISGKIQDLADLTPEKAPVPNYQRLGGAPASFWTFWRRGILFSLVGEQKSGAVHAVALV